MTHQGNVISFDDARRLASTKAKFPSVQGASAPQLDDVPSFVSPFARPKDQVPTPRADGSQRIQAAVFTAGSEGCARAAALDGFGAVSRSGRISKIGQGAAASGEDVPRLRRTTARSMRGSEWSEQIARDLDEASVRPAVEAYEEDSEEEGLSKRARQKKQRAKAKAEKMFIRQFGKETPSGEGGSRAAVYKAQMGRNHKRAFTEMGGRSETQVTAPRKLRAIPSVNVSRFVAIVGCAACVAAVVAFLFPVAQQAYIQAREEDRLQAEYEALLERNAALQDRIDYLNTDEGIENEAREQLGWVQEGEVAVLVEGLSDEVSDEEDSTVSIQIASGSIPAPDTWYSPVLDVLFGYTDPTETQ